TLVTPVPAQGCQHDPTISPLYAKSGGGRPVFARTQARTGRCGRERFPACQAGAMNGRFSEASPLPEDIPMQLIRHTSFLLAATIGLSAAIAGTLSTPAHAGEMPATHAAASPAQAGVYRYRLGNFEITALSDGTVPQDADKLLKGVSKAVIDQLLERSFQTNPVEGSINAFLIDTGTRLVLVDAGAGDFFGPGAGGKLVARLKTAGYTPAQIDDR